MSHSTLALLQALDDRDVHHSDRQCYSSYNSNSTATSGQETTITNDRHVLNHDYLQITDAASRQNDADKRCTRSQSRFCDCLQITGAVTVNDGAIPNHICLQIIHFAGSIRSTTFPTSSATSYPTPCGVDVFDESPPHSSVLRTCSRRTPFSFMSAVIFSIHRCFGLPLFLAPPVLPKPSLFFPLLITSPNYLHLFSCTGYFSISPTSVLPPILSFLAPCPASLLHTSTFPANFPS